MQFLVLSFGEIPGYPEKKHRLPALEGQGVGVHAASNGYTASEETAEGERQDSGGLTKNPAGSPAGPGAPIIEQLKKSVSGFLGGPLGGRLRTLAKEIHGPGKNIRARFGNSLENQG